MLPATLGTAIRTARKAQRISRADLAQSAGVSLRLVSELERGERPNVSLASALQILHLLGIGLRVTDEAEKKDAAALSRAARRAAREATWFGSIGSLNDTILIEAPQTLAGRIAAVTRVSELAYAIRRAAHDSKPVPSSRSKRDGARRTSHSVTTVHEDPDPGPRRAR